MRWLEIDAGEPATVPRRGARSAKKSQSQLSRVEVNGLAATGSRWIGTCKGATTTGAVSLRSAVLLSMAYSQRAKSGGNPHHRISDDGHAMALPPMTAAAS